MDTYENYYEILGVAPIATLDEIKKAYLDKCWIFADDRMQGAPESARRQAEEEHKKVNRAFEILKDTAKRSAYDKTLSGQNAGTTNSKGASAITKPKPIVEPTQIQFKKVKPGEVKKASFLIINSGGSYSKIKISNPDSWLTIIDWHSLSTIDELPLKVNIEAQGRDWNKTYSENININLDEAQTYLTVTLQTRLRLEIKDHNWHDIEFENLKNWVKKRTDRLDTGEELKGRTFRYRLKKSTGKYQIRLSHAYRSAVYDPFH
jgi:curved DNA-binding protein CbpA